MDGAAGRLDLHGEKIDERGLSRSIRTDQGVPGSLLETKTNVIGDIDFAELLSKIGRLDRGYRIILNRQGLPRFSCAGYRAVKRCTRESYKPRTPPRAKVATTIKISPSQNSQYTGSPLARIS